MLNLEVIISVMYMLNVQSSASNVCAKCHVCQLGICVSVSVRVRARAKSVRHTCNGHGRREMVAICISYNNH